MERMSRLALAVVATCTAWAQGLGPVILQRGVLNAVTLEPAPSRVAPGDPLLIRGLNLTDVQIFIAGREATVLSTAPDQVTAIVPDDAPGGLVNVVAQRGEQRSRAALVRVTATAIGARTKNGLGFGEAGDIDGAKLRLKATGFGRDEPAAVRAHVGGLPAAVKRDAGDVTIELPDGAQTGDIISVSSSGGPPVTRSTLGAAKEAVVQFLELPDGFRDVRALRQSDLRGVYLMANGPRGSDGCFPTWTFDLAKPASSRVTPCLLAQQNAVSPVVAVNESHVLAAFTGPASEQQNQVSSKLAIFNPTLAEPMMVDLPGPAAVLGSAADGSVTAIGGGTPYAINPDTGEVRTLTAQSGGGAGVPATGPGIVGAILQVDLGDGLNVLLSAPNLNAVIVGNDANKPTKAKLAILGNGGTVTGTRDFPASWIPLLPPAPSQQQSGPGQAQGPGVAGLRLPVFSDAATRAIYVLARKEDGSAQGMIAFSGAQFTPKELPFPAGWYAATCVPNLALLNLELSRRMAMFASKRPHEEILTPCPAQGYLALNLATQEFAAVPLPGVGEVNTRAASGEVNDYLYASNTDPQNANLSDTLYLFDSVAGSPFRLDLPAGILGFQQITPVPALDGLVATAIGTRVAGDGGLIFFDLENEKTTVFPVPEGFTTVNFVGVFANTRKLIARGIKANGAQYLIYDLVDGNLLMPANPEGVAYAGPLPAAAGGQGPPQQPQPQQPQVQAQLINAKANVIAALAYDSARTLVGILTIKVP